nr:MAG TPA: YsxB-like protein [Caudoviricetes sp.]
MIKIESEKDRLRVSGHAGYAEVGKDIVCSAVSILVVTLVESLKKQNENIKYKLEEGNLILYKQELGSSEKLLLSSFLIGIDMLEDMYPEYITRLGSD